MWGFVKWFVVWYVFKICIIFVYCVCVFFWFVFFSLIVFNLFILFIRDDEYDFLGYGFVVCGKENVIGMIFI